MILGGALLLTAVVAAFFGLANYRAGKVWQRILARNGVNLQHSTNGFTYSQSSGGRTIFTLHASKATPQGKGKWALHDAVLILYGREPGHDDRIYGSDFEYNEDEGVARALGEVHMDLQAPDRAADGAHSGGERAGLGFVPEDEAHADPSVIHVRTSGLVYMRKLGIAATDQQAEFRYKGISCTSRGAEFDSGQSTVRLLADVHMSGLVKERPFTLTASRVELNRDANTTKLADPVVVSGDRGARAQSAVLHLRKDGTLDSGEAAGAVQLRSGTQVISAPQMMASFGAENKPRHARLVGGVTFADASADRPAQGSAGSVDLDSPIEGRLSTVTAAGSVAFSTRETGGDGTVSTRRLKAQGVVASFVPDGGGAGGARLQRVHMTTGAEFRSDSAASRGGPGGYTQVDGDDLTTMFVPGAKGQAVPQQLIGTGHTRVEQSSGQGARQVSTGDRLMMAFAARTEPGAEGGAGVQEQVSSAEQEGHVVVEAWAAPKPGAAAVKPESTTGRADKASYDGARQTFTLLAAGRGRAVVDDAQGELVAPEIVLHQGTGDSEATGGVAATTGGGNGGVATHVLADHARTFHAAQVTEFIGTDADPAELWQGGSQVKAASIVLDGHQHTVSARPEGASGQVGAVFATAGRAEGAPSRSVGAHGGSSAGGEADRDAASALGGHLPAAARDAVQVSAGRMDYNDLRHEATFADGVRLMGTMGEVTAARGAAFLKAGPGAAHAAKTANGAQGENGADLSGSLERLVMIGDVHLQQPERSGTGEQLTYTAATNSYVLTGAPGKPPRVTGGSGGVVTGATLVFGAANSTIVVAGTPNTKAGGSTRVHTETDLKQ